MYALPGPHLLIGNDEDQQFPGPDFHYYSAAVMSVSDYGSFCAAYGVWALDPKDAAVRVMERVTDAYLEAGPVYVNIWSARSGMYTETAIVPRPARAQQPAGGAGTATIKLTED